MTARNIARNIVTSYPGLFILYGLPFGLLQYFFAGSSTHVSIIGAIVGGVFFGALMAALQLRRTSRFVKLAKRHEVKRNARFNQYLKSGSLPASVSERAKFIEYIDGIDSRRTAISKYYYPRPYSKLLTYGVLTVLFIMTITNKELRLLAFIYPIVIGVSLLGEYRIRVQKQRIEAVRTLLVS